jgi:O-methyltransferase involved in polyketide biosynthesis
VVPYLTREAVFSTLGFIAGLPGGAEAVFDYADPPSARTLEQRAAHQARAARVAAVGEPWLSYFTAELLASELGDLGFSASRTLAQAKSPPAISAARPPRRVAAAGT